MKKELIIIGTLLFLFMLDIMYGYIEYKKGLEIIKDYCMVTYEYDAEEFHKCSRKSPRNVLKGLTKKQVEFEKEVKLGHFDH